MDEDYAEHQQHSRRGPAHGSTHGYIPPPVVRPSEAPTPHPKMRAPLRKRNRAEPKLQVLHSFCCQDQLLANSRFHRRMAGGGNDHIAGFGPGAGQFVGAADRADHVIAALHDNRGQMPDPPDAGDQVTLSGEQMTAKEMPLDSRKAESEPILTESSHSLRVGQ